jgi:hypothetical protein
MYGASAGSWVVARAMRHTYDLTPNSGTDDPYFGTVTPGRVAKDRPCLWVATSQTTRDARGDMTTASGPALLVGADDSIKAGDTVANVREDGVVYFVGPAEVLDVTPASTSVRVVTLKGGAGR